MEPHSRNYTIEPPRHFECSARDAVAMLRERLPMDVWLVGQVQGDEFMVLAASEGPLEMSPGHLVEWSRTLCSRMTDGAPKFACRTDQVPEYANLLSQSPQPVGAYIGVPIRLPNGNIFGTLCGLSQNSIPREMHRDMPVVEFAASMLGRVLEAELLAIQLQRESVRKTCEAEFDVLTQLYNRRGWDELFRSEELRCRSIGARAAVVSIDLDELKEINDSEGHSAGDELLQRTANAIRFSIRLTDVAARIGGDEFAILLSDCGPAEAKKAVRRLESNLDLTDVRASVGLGILSPLGELSAAFEAADRQMRSIKAARKTLNRAVCNFAVDIHEAQTGA